MRAVIVSSSYSYLERVKLVKEFYDQQGYETMVLLTDYIHVSKTYAGWSEKDYIFINTKPYKKNISVQRLYSHYRFAQDVAEYLSNMKVDLLYVMLPANSLARVASAYKEANPDTHLYFDVVDLWPETMPIDHFKNTYPFRKWKALRDNYLEYAERIYCECNLFKQVMGKENDAKFRTLYWVKTNELQENTPNLSNEELKLCYLGSINNVIDINYIVKMCDELSKYRKVVLHIIGDGERRQELLQKLKSVNMDVKYHGLVYDAREKQEIFDQCHFGLNIMKPSVCVGLTMKSLDYFWAGLPVINNIHGDTWDMVEAYGIGFNGYEKLVEKLGELQQETYLVMRKNVRCMYEKHFTKEAFFKQMH